MCTFDLNLFQSIFNWVSWDAGLFNFWSNLGRFVKLFEPLHTVQYNTVQYSTVQYSTVQYSTVQYNTVQYSTVQYSTVQYSTVQYSTVQYSTAPGDCTPCLGSAAVESLQSS